MSSPQAQYPGVQMYPSPGIGGWSYTGNSGGAMLTETLICAWLKAGASMSRKSAIKGRRQDFEFMIILRADKAHWCNVRRARLYPGGLCVLISDARARLYAMPR